MRFRAFVLAVLLTLSLAGSAGAQAPLTATPEQVGLSSERLARITHLIRND
jgi:hypothetical protein